MSTEKSSIIRRSACVSVAPDAIRASASDTSVYRAGDTSSQAEIWLRTSGSQPCWITRLPPGISCWRSGLTQCVRKATCCCHHQQGEKYDGGFRVGVAKKTGAVAYHETHRVPIRWIGHQSRQGVSSGVVKRSVLIVQERV